MTTTHRLFIIPATDTRPEVVTEIVRGYITITVEASEDVTVENVGGVISVSTHWADAEWCETLGAKLESVTKAKCWTAYRKEHP